jgi:hypothetical protein
MSHGKDVNCLDKYEEPKKKQKPKRESVCIGGFFLHAQ